MKRLISNLMLSLLVLLLGSLMIIRPDRVMTVVFAILGIFMLASGLKNLYLSIVYASAISRRLGIAAVIKNAFNTIFSVLIVYFAFSNPEALMSITVYLIAIDLLVTALLDLLDHMILRRQGYVTVGIMEIVVRIAFSIFMFFFPYLIGSTVFRIVAIILVIYGVFSLIMSVLGFFAGKKHSAKEEIEVEWEVKH